MSYFILPNLLLTVSFLSDCLAQLGKRELIFLPSISVGFVSVRRGSSFSWCLG